MQMRIENHSCCTTSGTHLSCFDLHAARGRLCNQNQAYTTKRRRAAWNLVFECLVAIVLATLWTRSNARLQETGYQTGLKNQLLRARLASSLHYDESDFLSCHCMHLNQVEVCLRQLRNLV